MKRFMCILLVFALSGCAGASYYHTACMEMQRAFADQVACVKAEISQQKGLKDDTLVQEYLATGDVLVQQVRAGKIDETEARLRFTEKLNEIKEEELRQQAMHAQIDRAYSPRHTTCQPAGNGRVECTTY